MHPTGIWKIVLGRLGPNNLNPASLKPSFSYTPFIEPLLQGCVWSLNTVMIFHQILNFGCLKFYVSLIIVLNSSKFKANVTNRSLEFIFYCSLNL